MHTKTPIVDFDGAELPDLTVGSACVTALLATFVDEPSLNGEEKMRRFLLAQRIAATEDVDLTAEEIALTKLLVAKGYGTLVVGRVWAALDPVSVRQG